MLRERVGGCRMVRRSPLSQPEWASRRLPPSQWAGRRLPPVQGLRVSGQVGGCLRVSRRVGGCLRVSGRVGGSLRVSGRVCNRFSGQSLSVGGSSATASKPVGGCRVASGGRRCLGGRLDAAAFAFYAGSNGFSWTGAQSKHTLNTRRRQELALASTRGAFAWIDTGVLGKSNLHYAPPDEGCAAAKTAGDQDPRAPRIFHRLLEMPASDPIR